MALRQNIAEVPLGNGLFPLDLQRIKKSRPPVPGKFRYGGDLRELLETIRGASAVAVEAVVGAGKSTRLPGEIARDLGKLVIQVVPNDFLAYDLAEYVKSTGVDCVYRGDPKGEWPTSGVVLVSASGIVAHWLYLGRAGLPPCVLFHDESHESDAYTYFLKGVALAIPGVEKYVTATATTRPGDFRPTEAGGAVEAKKYLADDVSTEWDLYGRDGKPWEVESIHDNTLIFEDNKKNAERLVSEYNMAGFDTFRLHARMKLEQFKCAMTMARAQQEVVVFIADSTFRSGFTMPVSTVIDTAVVSMFTVEDGITTRCYRDAYLFERYQAAGRVGRIKGTKSVTWAPDVKPENKMVMLEDTDADAVVLLYRAFGKLCPLEFVDSPLSEGKVPRNVIQALQGYGALSTIHDNMLVDPREMADESGRRSPMVKPTVRLADRDTMDYENPIVSADVARNYQKSDTGKWEKRRSADSGYGEGVENTGMRPHGEVTIGDAISGMVDAAISEDIEIVAGGYYCAPSMPSSVRDFSPMFPDGYVSVLRMLASDDMRALQHGLTTGDRWVAVHALLTRLNIVSCELNGALSVARDVGSLAKERDPVAVREWVASFMSRVGEMQADSRVLIDCLLRVTHRFCEIQAIPHEVLQEQESKFANHMITNLRTMPLRNNSLRDVHSFVRKKVTDDIPMRIGGQNGPRFADAHASKGATVLDSVKMPRVGRGMRVTDAKVRQESNAMKIGRWLIT